ncbi:MAG: Na+/H+ antiporter [Pseudolabrys sp.]|jgi:CPA1 family monovalent cation:H+ antiporter
MTAIFQTILFMLAVLAAVAVAAKRLNIAPSILLVVAGVGMALMPGLPKITLAPELVLLVILPPLIYSAGVAMSWREFKFNLRPIALLAFGCVIFTTCMVAVVAHYLLGFDWPVGFLLGAIIAPPDTVAPLTIARRLGLPRRLVVVLEGEGLANDATALILYRFAVVAVTTGAFSPAEAAGTFSLIVVGEVFYGIAIGWLSLHLRKWAHEPRVEITLSLMTPYLAFWIPEHLGGSGVLATVACGLYVSWNGPLLIPSGTRLQGIFFWDLIIYLIEGLVFLLTGLQARTLIEQSHVFSLRELAIAIAWTTLVVILARFVWVFPATYLPRWLIRSVREHDPSPPWQGPFLLSFTGIRGVVSLAAALALPYIIANGQPFPHRDLILFIVFGVIIVTLVGQGLMLPAVVRALGLTKLGKEEHWQEIRNEIDARRAALKDVTERLDKAIADKELPDYVASHLRVRNQGRQQVLPQNLTEDLPLIRQTAALKLELIGAERVFIYQLLREGRITDEARRRIEYELDLEEASLANRGKDGGGWM